LGEIFPEAKIQIITSRIYKKGDFMDKKKWWKQRKPFRLAPHWKIMWNKLEDIEPDDIGPDDEAWLFTFVEDITYIVTESIPKKNRKTMKRTLAVDLGWYPEGDIKGCYYLVAILDKNWSKPILEMKTRSTQKVVDTIELWLFETLVNWESMPYHGRNKKSD